MAFNPPVPQQDSNWEIRVAVLLSLLLQVLLLFLGPTRKRFASPIPRFIMWSCYLLADWVADLGLGLILNNMLNNGGGGNSADSDDSSSPIIFAFWTPFLLLHLGGPDTITAYSLEDNELWLRHLIGLLFEVFSACVIFFCSLHGNPMIHATVLIFVVGIIKYAERTYSLYSGSIERLRDSMVGPPDPGLDYAKFMGEFDARKKAGEDVEITITDTKTELKTGGDVVITITDTKPELDELEELQSDAVTVKSLEGRAYEFFLVFRRLFVDVIISFQQRMKSRAFFVEQPDLKPKEALEVVEVELSFVYDMVYTKAPIAHTLKGWILRSTCSSCLVTALIIFFLLDKPHHQVKRVDVGITYTLLLGGLALDAAALIMLLFSIHVTVFLEQSKWLAWLARLSRAVTRWRHHHSSWSGSAIQMNLIRYCVDKPGPYSSSTGSGGGGAWKKKNWRRLIYVIAKMLCMEEMVDDFVFTHHVELVTRKEEKEPYGTLEFIFDGLKLMAHNLGNNTESIMQVCNRRGAGVLQDPHLRETLDPDRMKVIMESVESRGFDESLLLWHIATDLCLRCRDGDADKSPPAVGAGPREGDEDYSRMLRRMRAISKILSEYMLYLLIKQPDMLSTAAGIGLRPYRDTCAEARRFFASAVPISMSTDDNHEDARQALLRVNTSRKPMMLKGDRSKSVLFDGVILAKVLRELDEEIMWRLVSGLWMEMLTFAAVSSRGSTHVRRLNRGGELITIVWLLMQHMGLSDMYEVEKEDPILQLSRRRRRRKFSAGRASITKEEAAPEKQEAREEEKPMRKKLQKAIRLVQILLSLERRSSSNTTRAMQD